MKGNATMQAATNLSDGASRAILLIAGDRDVYPYLKSNLRREGYQVLMALDVEDAREWMGGGYVHADVVIIDLVGTTTDEALGFGREVRRHAKYDGHTPLVVMAEKYGREVEGTDVNVEGNDWVMYLGEETRQLESLLARLLDGHHE
jgi:DNA-binding response OmpR family regulator